MILGPGTLVHYLLDCGLLTTRQVVDGELVIVACPGRHQTFKVFGPGHAAYFVKQVRYWTPQEQAMLHREATCYQLACHDADFATLQPLLPHQHRYDPDFHVLVLDLLPGARTVSECYWEFQSLSLDLGVALGAALASYHGRAGAAGVRCPQGGLFPRGLPWVMNVEHPECDPPAPAAAGAEVLRLLRQRPDYLSALEAASRRWQVTGFIHGDMKWDNCLVLPGQAPETTAAVKIVDWELADFGDPCWDVAGILQSFLTAWLVGLPLTGADALDQLGATAPPLLQRLQPVMQAFWQSYLATRAVEADAIPELLERTTVYCAARLLQTTFEYMAYDPQLTLQAVCMLQVGLNILNQPRELGEALLGLRAH